MTESIQQICHLVAHYYVGVAHLGSLYVFGICGLIFIPLSMCPVRSSTQPPVHKGMIPDALYWFLGPPLIYGPITVLLFGLLLDSGLYSLDSLGQVKDGLVPVLRLPALLQAGLILVIMDLLQYWVHRVFHTASFWKFHVIHHSAVNVDWLTSTRFHPIDILIHSYCTYLLVPMIGFSSEAWLLVVPFNAFYSPLVHANLNWDYGPFRYLLVSPVFHRWHHTHAEEGGNSNFAPTFPFLDFIFGTYYEPKGVRPSVFGTPSNPVADTNIVNQLLYPFSANVLVD